MMICLNDFYVLGDISKKVFKDYLLLLKPFAPDTVSNIWKKLFKDENLSTLPFPAYDEVYLQEDIYNYPVMINGKTRAIVPIKKHCNIEEIKNIILDNDIVKKWMQNGELKNIIILKEKVISIVI